MFRKLLVANRGEIARRIIRVAKSMNVGTVAVHSDADAELPFVAEADEAVRIGPAPAKESYLDVRAILDAARRTGASTLRKKAESSTRSRRGRTRCGVLLPSQSAKAIGR